VSDVIVTDGDRAAAEMSLSDSEYFLCRANESTIGELRELNKSSMSPFALQMLLALIQAGVDVTRERDAVVRQTFHIGDVVEMRWCVLLQGKLIAILGEGDADDYRVLAKRKKP
jgi:hypothetical protein